MTAPSLRRVDAEVPRAISLPGLASSTPSCTAVPVWAHDVAVPATASSASVAREFRVTHLPRHLRPPQSFHHVVRTPRRNVSSTGRVEDCCLDNLSSRRVDRLVALVLALVCRTNTLPVGCSPSRFCCCLRCRARLDFRHSRDGRARGASNAHVALRLRHSRRIFAGPHSSHSGATRSSESSLTRDARGRRSTSSAAECPADSPLEH